MFFTAFALTVLLNPFTALRLEIDKLRSKQFAMCWSVLGKPLSNDFPPALETMINVKCHGKVLDIGPGSGFQLKRFRGAFQAGRIEQIYGVEPGVDMHDQLRAHAIGIFAGDAPRLYKILSCGAQPTELVPALAVEGTLGRRTQGLFDTIICIRVLCGIPQPQETVDLFYRLLKPGGSIIFLEHVINSGDWNRNGSIIARLVQQAYQLAGWSFWAGGCELTRDTLSVLKQAAKSDSGWAQVQVMENKPQTAVPEIYGYMVKRS